MVMVMRVSDMVMIGVVVDTGGDEESRIRGSDVYLPVSYLVVKFCRIFYGMVW